MVSLLTLVHPPFIFWEIALDYELRNITVDSNCCFNCNNFHASDDVLKMLDNVWPEFETIKLQNAKSPPEIGVF